ncbi:hypothetical protein Q9966_002797 [Columba livia]|nr:hypothetical protein Q9966_002797 [Columba livia]
MVTPSEASSPPAVSSKADKGSLWTVLLTNPDSSPSAVCLAGALAATARSGKLRQSEAADREVPLILE